ncbi:MAG: bifunctional folylpolyglutamate synthase/dihydrofolate synthase [Clostridia bacterium]|nr:bifunctional folylpolyglutamate synthase/dihydrofolate synthase [Clostridia bacterium]
MTAEQVISAIQAARYTGKKNGLDNTVMLLNRLGVAPDAVHAIHVAGTNGKGSVCAMIESALSVAGFRTGLFTSPFLQRYNERIAIQGQCVSDEDIGEYGALVLEAGRDINATAFELGTALAWLIFKEKGIDVAILETGLGGRLDPTNVMIPRLSVITAIGLDHTEVLGDTIEKIAREKAGIIKPGVPVVVYPCANSVRDIITDAAKRAGSEVLFLRDTDLSITRSEINGSTAQWAGLALHIPLPGEHQCLNAMTAAAALRRYGINDKCIREGISRCVWPARLEWAGNVLIDGAHNAHGARSLRWYTDSFLKEKKRVLIVGMLGGKLTEEMISEMSALSDTVITVTPAADKAIPAGKLAEYFNHAYVSENLAAAIRTANNLAGGDGVIIITGSLYLAGEARTLLGLKPR